MSTIGFFGDSFCAKKDMPFFSKNTGTTYIKKLELNYNTKILQLGVDGSSIWDLILLQFNPIKTNLPDICIFVWTNNGRLFHREVRNINASSLLKHHNSKNLIWKSAQLYYENLHDWEKEDLEHLSVMHYFDTEILSKLDTGIKIIHLWSYGDIDWDNRDRFNPENIKYPYRWKTGMEIRPALASISMIDVQDDNIHFHDSRPNHLDGEQKNELVFSWIKHAIDNYNPGSCLNFDYDVINFIK